MSKTMILALGGAGGNIAETICRDAKQTELKEANYLFADTDENSLKKHNADNRQLIVLNPEQDAFPEGVFTEVEKLYIIAGMGGMTGSKFLMPAVSEAKKAGVMSIQVITTTPFLFEGEKRLIKAIDAALPVSRIKDVELKAFNNENLVKNYPDLGFADAFKIADKEILAAIEEGMA